MTTAYVPTMMYADEKPTYEISGNTATVNVDRTVSPTSRDGTLNVSFRSGVSIVVIEYLIAGRMGTGSTSNNLYQ